MKNAVPSFDGSPLLPLDIGRLFTGPQLTREPLTARGGETMPAVMPQLGAVHTMQWRNAGIMQSTMDFPFLARLGIVRLRRRGGRILIPMGH